MANIVQADWDAFWERQEALCGGQETVTRSQPIPGAPIWPNRNARAADARAACRDREQAAATAQIRGMLRSLLDVDTTPVKILCLGDSITAGAGSFDGQGYRPYLVDMLDQQHYTATVVVDAVSGSTLPDVVSRWPTTRAAHPDADVVLLCVGTNDSIWTASLTGWQAAYDTFVGQVLADLPAARVVCAKIPLTDSTATVTPVAPPLLARQAALNGWIGGVVTARAGTGRVALADMSVIPSSWLLDAGLHPGDTGYQRMARIWADALNTLST